MDIKYCQTCGKERHYKSKPGNCQECHIKQYRIQKKNITLNKLKNLGYEILTIPDNASHAKITIKRLSCGHIFTCKVNNLITRRTKCSVCGPKERIKKCMAGYMAKNARDYDLKKWEDYRNYVRRVSNKTYKENIQKLNPQNLIRSKKDNHLDHKIPLIVCFKEGVDANVAGSLQNLCFVSARDNLSKNKHSYNKKLLEKLRLKSYT